MRSCNADSADLVQITFDVLHSVETQLRWTVPDWAGSVTTQEGIFSLAITDYTLLQMYRGDVDGDGKLLAGDARKILRYSAKLETAL